MADLTLWKQKQINKLRDELDGMIAEFFRDFGGSVFDEIRGEVVVTDMTEDDHNLVISADLPGIMPNDLEVNVSPELLVISGTKSYSRKDAESRIQRRSSFSSHIKLPCRIEPEKVEAVYEKNRLKISLPKCRSTVFRKIPVHVSEK